MRLTVAACNDDGGGGNANVGVIRGGMGREGGRCEKKEVVGCCLSLGGRNNVQFSPSEKV